MAVRELLVTDNLPSSAVVFDWFHIVKLLNDKLSQLRRDLYREANNQLPMDVLTGFRWLLWKRLENHDNDRNESDRLQEALKLRLISDSGLMV